MGVSRVFARSLGRCFCDNSRPYLTPSQSFLSFITVSQQIVPCNSDRWQFQYQNRRTFILESSGSEFVKLQRLGDLDSGIFEVSLDRPGAKNAIGKDMLRDLRHALEFIDREPSAKVAMIRSSVPGVFCAGADLKERRTMNLSATKDFVNSLRSSFSFLEALCVPTIAIIEGVAFGGGLEMALACDIRICGEDALMSLPETGLAIIPGAGGTQRLPRLVGKATAKDIIFTGRKINSKDALSMGLVDYCVPAGEAHSKALAVAQDICQKGPIAIRMAKRAINEGIETDLTTGLALEEGCYDEVLNTKDRLEGLAAFAEKRKPKYTGE
ncbi:probable enoyl-CoA hydratase 2, mitochondrial [Prosopis cineraria]|uniref:probable enoyl-CoA hydratase 2, mitochondrial n=1 Tax=Prosopis cineraria TaxID=364024 RepID=UPI0024109199|nr:probable enoyl-CoA hydratase 2, mitochondrial [Prosopis cineraria]